MAVIIEFDWMLSIGFHWALTFGRSAHPAVSEKLQTCGHRDYSTMLNDFVQTACVFCFLKCLRAAVGVG